jgi:hypothetical protein
MSLLFQIPNHTEWVFWCCPKGGIVSTRSEPGPSGAAARILNHPEFHRLRNRDQMYGQVSWRPLVCLWSLDFGRASSYDSGNVEVREFTFNRCPSARPDR